MRPIDPAVDHVRGPRDAPLILEYGDYECPYSRMAFRQIQQVEQRVPVGFAFRHFPLTQIHPHALAAAAAAEAAARQGRFWEMHELLFRRQHELEDDDLRTYAGEIELDLSRFERDRSGDEVVARIARDITSGQATGVIRGTPTLFIDGVLHEGGYDTATLLEALARDVR